jgi:HAMP domain-containing protein
MAQQQTDTDTLDLQRLFSVLTALHEGDLSRRLPTGGATRGQTRGATVAFRSPGQEGAGGAIAEALNTLIDRLEAVASETNRILREVIAGKFGGQAQVNGLSGAWKEFPTREDLERFQNGAQAEGLSGTWKELIDNLNAMSATLTHQVRDISSVTEEVANGSSSLRATVNAQGEMLLLKELVNTLVDQRNGRQSQYSPG